MEIHAQRRLTSSQIILLGFAALILLGTAVLMLPVSTRGSGHAPFADALFTATSAVCVTGLVVHDTALYWSGFGQAVILLLIQIGGMGVVTVAVSVTMFSGRKIGLMQRGLMQESISAPRLGGIVRLTRFILAVSFTVEAVGAVLLYLPFSRVVGGGKAVWYAVFHSVSAFCNAGFDLMGVWEAGSSLTAFSANPLVNITVVALILIGGLGFLTWDDLRCHGFHWQSYSMQSKVILSLSAALLVLPFCFFYGYEFARAEWGTLGGGERLWLSLFHTVTPRTAGFNTADLSRMSEEGRCVTICLMLLGGAPGSTAGGMKITTLAVLMASAAAVFKRNEESYLFRRRIPQETIRSAAAVALLYTALLLGGGLFISCREALPLGVCLFEAASALCTVGLSVGATAQLGAASRAVLIALMFLGRIGGLTLVFAALRPTDNGAARYPQESIHVG